MNTLPWGLQVWKRGCSEGKSVGDVTVGLQPEQMERVLLFSPSLKSQKPCCCFLKKVEETCVSAESFLHSLSACLTPAACKRVLETWATLRFLHSPLALNLCQPHLSLPGRNCLE